MAQVIVFYPKYGPSVTEEIAIEVASRAVLSRGWRPIREPEVHVEPNPDAERFASAPRQQFVVIFDAKKPTQRGPDGGAGQRPSP